MSESDELLLSRADGANRDRSETQAGGSYSLVGLRADGPKALEYWRTQLAGEVPQPQLPFDHPRPLNATHPPAVERFELPAAACNALKQVANAAGASLYVSVMAGVVGLMQRYSALDEIIIGGSRLDDSPGAAAMGSFEDLLALRIDLPGEPSFQQLLARVQSVFAGAKAHAGIPFSEVLKEVRPGRPPGVNSLFNVAVLPSADAQPESSTGDSALDLSFSFEDRGDRLCVAITYAADLFDRASISEITQHWQNFVTAACEAPAQPISELPILSASERKRIVREWNETHADYDKKCVHELFERQAAKTPDLTAVVHQGRTLTYRELNERANQVAHFLRTRGVGPETLIGVCQNRTPELVISLLGIWKAGGAYIPLDPTYPADRLSFMMKDSAAKFLVTTSELSKLFPSATENTILIDSDWDKIAKESTANPAPSATPANLAYVMYTSGSTGTPKGAMILHGGLANYLTWAIRTYGAVEGGSVPVHSSISFDLTVTSMYPALLAGGNIELLPEDVGAQSLLASLRRAERNLVKITPAHLELLSQEIRPSEAAAMTKVFVIGGENLLAENLRLWREHAPKTRLINEYGPTETVVGCCIYEVRAEDPRSGSVIIGRPIANTQLYILDSHKNPVPAGVAGELYIGGDGVARGYLNRPELTAQKFIPDPFSGREGALLYRTGDLARYRKDGNLEFLGRIDSQVKVRGYRIELGEIEAALMEAPGVKLCAVLAREDEPGDKQLVAYAVPAEGGKLAVEEIRQFLQKKLPKYMVPAHFVVLDSFPLTTNGKVDRKALPAPGLRRAEGVETPAQAEATESDSPVSTQERARPQTETEKALVAIWSEMLHVESPGLNDDFFNLGGHSLLAIKIISRIRDVFGVDLPTQTLFEHPTIAGLAAVISESNNAKAGAGKIERRRQTGPSILSYAQEQLWFLNQLAPGSPVYNVVDAIRFEGPYNAAAMKRAVEELAKRHEVLRTVFFYGDGRPMQNVLPEIPLAFQEIDLTPFAGEDQKREWKRVVDEEGRKPFDLSAAPLFRVAIVHLGPAEHKLLLTIHHIIADEWSMEIVHDELTQLYRAFAQGRPSPLPELPIQYADFAAWQRDWMQGEVLEAQAAHWKKELSGSNPVLELPSDKPRPAVQSFRGSTEIFDLPAELSEQLKALGREQQATLFMILEAAFAVLLNRYTGQDDILVGTPISGRTRSETERLIGFFLNTVVLRSQFTERLNFRTLLQQTRERALSAYAHPDMPFEQLVAEIAPGRDTSQSPLFQAMFVLHDAAGVSEVSKASGNQELSTGTSKFDLTLVLSEGPTGLQGLFEYSTDLFEQATIRRMCGHFQTLLEAIARDPEQKISRLPMLTAPERQQQLTEWNATAISYPEKNSCLHELLVKQAAKTPDRVAQVFDGREMTYGELDQRSNQLAAHLRKLGVGPDQLVGLLVERSLEMLVGLVGILKAGGAYIPLDPSFPGDRLSYMVEDSGMKVLITHRGLEQNLAVKPSTIVRLDSDWDEIASAPTEPSATQASSGASGKNLAYVLYTSGSTGKPKGVGIPHSAIVNFVLSIKDAPGFTEADTILAVTTLSFDIAGLELYVPLITGGKVVIASTEDSHDPARLQQRIAESRCTVMQATPATWRALIQSGWKGSPNLKILCGGEAMPRDLAEELLGRCGQLWNMYGPTETTVWSTVQRVEHGGGPVSIGKPIANTQVYVLDKYKNLVPRGAVGELYIGGDGLARGYLHRDELTRERFVTSPFVRNALIYRTGDTARWLPDGTVECLGRIDGQVKIRGYRIELSEVEIALGAHEGVKQCVVVTREDTPGNKVLAAYFVARAVDAIPSTSDLRAHLKKTLPEYMVPSAFVSLERLPLTPNGKIDRKALPAPVDQSTEATADSGAPRDAIEQMLCHVWAKALDVKHIGLHDNFFELGGHSLLAVRIVADVEKLFGTRLPLATLLQAPTVAELAEVLRSEHWTPHWSSLVPIRPGGSKPPLFLMHSHGGNVIEYHTLANELDPDQPVYALQTRGLDGRIEKGRSIEEMAATYLEEIRSFQPEGPYYLGGFCLGGSIALAAAQQLIAEGEEVALIVMIQTTHPDAIRFKPGVTKLQQLRYKLSKRVDLEIENLSHRGWRYIAERWRHLWDRGGARLAMLLDSVAEKENSDPSKLPMNYILEVLGDEHGKALSRFSPAPYHGDVVLFRASKQLGGQNIDEMLGWKSVLLGSVEICEIPGHQQNMMLPPNVSKLGSEITGHLKAAHERMETRVPATV